MGEPDAVACSARGQGYDRPASSAWSNSGEHLQEHRAVTESEIEAADIKAVAEKMGVDELGVNGRM